MTRPTALLALTLAACSAPSTNSGDDIESMDAGTDSSPDAAPVPTKITITLAEHAPTTRGFLLAYRDGGGPWTQLADHGGDTFSFTVTSGRWTFVWACEAQLEYVRDQVNMLSFTTAERTSYTSPELCPHYYYDTVPFHLTMQNAAVAYPDSVGLSYGPQWMGLDTMSNGKWLRGTHDAYLVERHPEPNTIYSSSATRVAVKRAFTLGASGATLTMDFATAIPTGPAYPVTIHVPTATPGIDVYPMSETTMFDPSGTRVTLAASSLQNTGLTRGLAAAQELPGTVYEQNIRSSICNHEAQYCDEVDLEHWTTTIGARDVTPVADFGTVTPMVVGNRLVATYPAYPGAAGYTWNAFQNGSDMRWIGVIGKGYAGNAPTIELPDLSSLELGSLYPFRPADRLTGNVSAIVTPLGLADVPPQYPAPAGTDRTIVSGHLYLPGT